ncbi:MAG: glycine cleavage system aminomethyltransferase GcvT [Candidatus Omnitrophota bacterium]
MELKTTPLYQKHIDSKARIVDFTGWALPVEYASVLKETRAVRTSCGLFDVSHMGEIRIKGKGALAFLQYLTSNDISRTTPGQLQYNLFLNENAGIIDDLMVYNCADSFLCVVNASNCAKVYQWLVKNKSNDVQIVDESETTALLSLQGPFASCIIEKVFAKSAANIGYMHFIEYSFLGKKIIISRSGYTGEDGFEIYCNNQDAVSLWDSMVAEGRQYGLMLCGLGARDILRIEAGYPLYGHEINEDTNPLEASLEWAVKLKKEFISKEKLCRMAEAGLRAGLRRKRIGFVLLDRALPRQGYPIYRNSTAIGEVTSGAYSPNLNVFIGMGYVEKDYSSLGTPIAIKIRDTVYNAKVSSFTFIKSHTKK